MRFIKTVSVLSIMIVGMSSVVHAAPMTSQIRRLLQEKEEKIKQLEQCDSKRKGWMIAGVSTIGLTAVGVGVNIAQASKSNKLSDEIDSAKQELDRYEYKLSDINARIADKERERAEKAKNADDTPAGESDDETVIQSDQSPELDPDHPNIGDECDDGAGRWVEKAAAFGICIKDTGLTPCECVSDANLTKPKIDESPLKDKPKEPTVKVSDDSKTSTDNKPVKKTENKSEPKQVENNKSVERTNKPVKDIESVLNSTHINKDSGVDLKTETTLTQTSTTTGSISKTDSSSSTNLSGGPSSSLTGIEEKSEVDTKESQTSRPGPTNVAYQEAMAEQERAETEAAGQAAANKYFEDLAKYGISPQQVNKTDSELNPAYR